MEETIKGFNIKLSIDGKDLEYKLNDILQMTRKKLETHNQELEKVKQVVKLRQMSETEFNKLARNVAFTEVEVSKLNKNFKIQRKSFILFQF